MVPVGKPVFPLPIRSEREQILLMECLVQSYIHRATPFVHTVNQTQERAASVTRRSLPRTTRPYSKLPNGVFVVMRVAFNMPVNVASSFPFRSYASSLKIPE